MAIDLTTMDETKPDGATEQVAALDNYLREVRDNLKDWADVEHGLTGGRHKFAIGNTASRPATGLETGTIYINTQVGTIEYYDGAAWQQAVGVIDAILQTLIDAKGDLIAGSADDTAVRVAVGSNGQVLTADSGQASGLAWSSVTQRGYLYGMGLTNNGADATNDIDIAAGECASDDAAATDRILLNPGAMTKQLDVVWAAGSAAGGRISTEGLADGTWHVYAFRRTGGTDDLCFSQSLTPTLPDSGTKKRRIGSIVRASAAIIAFIQDGDFFQHSTPLLDYNVTNPGTAAVTVTLTVPTGINVLALVNATASDDIAGGTQTNIYLSDLATTDLAPSITAAPLASAPNNAATTRIPIGPLLVRTNTSGQIRARLSA